MKGALLVSGLVAVMALTAVPTATLAASPADPTMAHVSTTTVALTQAQCQVLAKADPQHAATILKDCSVTVTAKIGALVTAGVSPSVRSQAVAAASCAYHGYSDATYTWTYFPGYWVSVSAKYELDYCNNVMWDWVTCDEGWAFPWTITEKWCDAYPAKHAWYYYKNTDVGINYIAVAPYAGLSHGARWGVNPITYTWYGLQQW